MCLYKADLYNHTNFEPVNIIGRRFIEKVEVSITTGNRDEDKGVRGGGEGGGKEGVREEERLCLKMSNICLRRIIFYFQLLIKRMFQVGFNVIHSIYSQISRVVFCTEYVSFINCCYF